MKYLPNSNRIGIEYHELVPEFMSESNYKYHKSKGNIIVHGRGGNGNQILVEFDRLPEKMQREIEEKHGGDLYEYMSILPIKNMVTMDMKARGFFAKHLKPGGGYLPVEAQQQYSRAADWLNMILFVLEDKRALKEHLKITEIKEFWKRVIELHQLDKPVNPKLPTTYDNLRKLASEYKETGYAALISKKFGNQNTRKVTGNIERLLMSLYCMPDKPYLQETMRRYWKFIEGTLRVVDLETGEVFDPKDFYITNGAEEAGKPYPYKVSAATVKHYINMPRNRQVVDKARMSTLEYLTTHVPYLLRKGPEYAFSTLTMDDTSSPFKMHDNTRPSCYKIFDLKSGAQVGFAMQRKNRPDVALIRQALMNMFQHIISNGWKMPAEIEVENALTSAMTGNVQRKGKAGIKDRAENGLILDVLTAGAVFAHVTFCAAQNPQEKGAEGFINQIKYQFQKHREGFQHRIFARREANRANKDSESHKMTFTFDEIEAMERADMQSWNESEHPDHPGMTRWEVCDMMQNPTLNEPHLPSIMKYVGYPTETSVRRMRVQVMGNLYRLPNAQAIEELDNKRLMAYWIAGKELDIPVVYLYQGDQFVCTAMKEGRFQRSKVEQTHEDLAQLGDQRRYKSNMLERVADNAVPMVGITTAIEDDEREELGKYADVIPQREQMAEPVWMPIEGEARKRASNDF